MTKPVPRDSYQIGVSRPALGIEDLPTPEEVFKVKHIGAEELLLFVLGPGLICLGAAIASGEWLLGPLSVSQYGFRGIGWVILASAVLQTFYNVELARFTVATGEPPVVAFGRMPPGCRVWVPLALLSIYMAFILGGWTATAGASLFALFAGRPSLPTEIETVRTLGIALLGSAFLFILLGRKIERTLEILQAIFLTFAITGLVLVTLVVVPFHYWGPALLSLVTLAMPPKGTDPSLLGALAGFTALASGLNFMAIGLYRDKGYGMGHGAGYLAGLIGGKRVELLPVGRTFPEDEKNAACWKRWFRYLLIDQWGIFFTGSIIGMMAPCILVGYLASAPGAAKPERGSIVVYAAMELGYRYGPVLFGWALVTGFLILYKSQIVFLELLARNFVDGANSVSANFHRWFGSDPRRFYYPFLLLLVALIGGLIHLAQPVRLILISANLSNLASMIFPLVVIYLNRQLPKPARITWWSYVVLAANTVFFGFFFMDFAVTLLTGKPVIRF